tara:strand:- start:356 stop:913 length:558 start_codon:yes stop_codon:yes gene_type:complete
MKFVENVIHNSLTIKGITVELFILKQNKIVTQKVFDDYEMFEDTDGKIYYVEHNMIGLELNLFRPILISRSEMPLKGDMILFTNIFETGECSIENAEKNLSNKDVYNFHTNKKEIYKIIVNYNEFEFKSHLENIKKGSWVHGQQFFVECDSGVYDKNRLKEVDYNLYDSSLSIFKIKEPIVIHLF